MALFKKSSLYAGVSYFCVFVFFIIKATEAHSSDQSNYFKNLITIVYRSELFITQQIQRQLQNAQVGLNIRKNTKLVRYLNLETLIHFHQQISFEDFLKQCLNELQLTKDKAEVVYNELALDYKMFYSSYPASALQGLEEIYDIGSLKLIENSLQLKALKALIKWDKLLEYATQYFKKKFKECLNLYFSKRPN